MLHRYNLDYEFHNPMGGRDTIGLPHRLVILDLTTALDLLQIQCLPHLYLTNNGNTPYAVWDTAEIIPYHFAQNHQM